MNCTFKHPIHRLRRIDLTLPLQDKKQLLKRKPNFQLISLLFFLPHLAIMSSNTCVSSRNLTCWLRKFFLKWNDTYLWTNGSSIYWIICRDNTVQFCSSCGCLSWIELFCRNGTIFLNIKLIWVSKKCPSQCRHRYLHLQK